MEIRLTRKKAIRAKCLDCCCGNAAEVRRCPCADCPLYPYRMGREVRGVECDEEENEEENNAQNAYNAVADLKEGI